MNAAIMRIGGVVARTYSWSGSVSGRSWAKFWYWHGSRSRSISGSSYKSWSRARTGAG